MKKNTSAVSVIGGADGPTSVFILGNAKPTLRQKLQRLRYQIKRLVVEKTLKCESHSMDEVMAYLVDRYGFVEVDPESNEVAEEYRQMRASFLIQFAPELLGAIAVAAYSYQLLLFPHFSILFLHFLRCKTLCLFLPAS